MTIKKTPANAVAVTGTNILFVDVPRGAALISVSALNNNRAVVTQMNLGRVGDNPLAPDVIPLLWTMQDSLYWTIWSASQPWPVADWRRVFVYFAGCVALDNIEMVMTYDE